MATRLTTACSAQLLIHAGLLSVMCIPCAVAGTPETIELTGIVRDFRQAHADFDVVPLGGNGHYAGNIDLTLGSEDRPAFVGGGFKLESQWRNSGGQPIAPHLYRPSGAEGGDTVSVVEDPILLDEPTVDTFDSSLGPYGGSNVGPAPTFDVGAPMPVLTEPTSLGPHVRNYIFDGAGTTTLDNDLHCDKFLIGNGHILTVSGSVTVLVEEEFTVQNYAKVEIMPGSSLALYVKKDATVQDSAEVNYNTANPSRLMIFNLGYLPFNLQNESHLYGQLQSPAAELLVQNNAHFYGRFIGELLHVKNEGGFHFDTNTGPTMCGDELADEAGAPGMVSNGAITSPDTFSEWYRDILGSNLSMHHSITLIRDDAGVYEYLDNAFYPADGRLLGNEGDVHNNYFTYTIRAEFVYEACTGQFIEFQGSDDAWLFVNGDLVLDLGGILPGTEQVIEVDRLGLQDGEFYELHFFFAQRQSLEAIFRLRTNIPLIGETTVATISGAFD